MNMVDAAAAANKGERRNGNGGGATASQLPSHAAQH